MSIEVDIAPLHDDDGGTLASRIDGAPGEWSLFHVRDLACVGAAPVTGYAPSVQSWSVAPDQAWVPTWSGPR